MFNQSNRQLDRMYERWAQMTGREREMLSREIFESMDAQDRTWVDKMTARFHRGLGGGSYVNLVLSLILDPVSREGVRKGWTGEEMWHL